MRLRTQLLVLALVALVLPWAGWQFVRGLESRLREGQAGALADSAGVLAGALAAAPLDLPPPDPVWFVHEAARPIALDGDPSDWGPAWEQAQSFGAPGDPRLRIALARYGGALHLFATIVDPTPVRRDASGITAGDGDALRVLLDRGDGVQALRLANARPGPLVIAQEGEAADAVRLAGAWAEYAGGHAVELRFTGSRWPQRLGIEAVDVDAAGRIHRHGSAPDRLGGLWPLARTSDRLSQRLARIVPAGMRAQVLHPDGWVLAEAGSLAGVASQPLPAWQRWLYGWLAEEPPEEAEAVAELGGGRGDALAQRRELREALARGGATRWSRPDGGVQLRLTAIAPLREDGTPAALLRLERRSDAALLAQQALTGLLGATLLAMLAVGGVLFAYASWLGYRVRRLGRAVDQAMARERGAPPLFAASQARDEIGELSRRFARLLEEVAGYTDYLRTLASKLSHELHTPLAVVRGSLENLEEQPLPASARPYVERARDGGSRLAAIIRAMSEATRVERAIAGADAERFDLRELVAGCAEGYRPLLAPRPLSLRLPDRPLPFHGAPELLAQALDKLVDNARGFTPADGWVALSLAQEGDGVVLSLANAGPPLPPEARGRLFDSLVSLRGRGSRDDGTPHLGLGLHIVRLITELHRGEAEALDLPGGGVEFRLRLRGMAGQGQARAPDSPG